MNLKKYMVSFFAAALIFTQLLSPLAATYTPSQINTTAVAAYIVNADTGNPVYKSNEEQEVPMASTTKIMTALLVVENVPDLQQKVVVSEEAIAAVPAGSSLAYLAAGEELTYDQLLSCLMVRSGNDAANALAVAVGGSLDQFISMMNAKAAQLNLTHTHFANAHGFDQADHYTSAKDLALLTVTALKNENFVRHYTEKSVLVPATNKMAARSFSSTCPNFSQQSAAFTPLVVGAKTGHTLDAKRCQVTYIESNQGKYISVLLGCPTGSIEGTTYPAYETKAIAAMIDTVYSVSSFGDATFSPVYIPVKNMAGGNETAIYQQSPVYGLFDKNTDVSGVTSKVTDTIALEAPVKAGSVAGEITYYLGEEVIGTSPLIVTADIEKSTLKEICNNVLTFLSYTWVIFVAILTLFFFYMFEVASPSRKRRKSKKR